MLNRYQYTGMTEEESLGNGWQEACHPDDLEEATKLWHQSLDTGYPYSTEYRCRNRDGEYRWMLVRALPMRNMETGAVERWFGTYTDIQETVETRSAAKQLVSLSCS
jgi:PAS domain S-box-containing protein